MQPEIMGPLKALIVDDSLSDVLLLREALDFHAFDVALEVIHDGETALESLRPGRRSVENRPDLIILDLNLPKVDGFEILGELKANRRLQTIPVVIMSSSSSEYDIMRAYSLGANAYVVKPVTWEELLKATQSLGEFWLHTAKLLRRDLDSLPKRRIGGRE